MRVVVTLADAERNWGCDAGPVRVRGFRDVGNGRDAATTDMPAGELRALKDRHHLS
jgi:hypothetical protein